MTPKQRTLGLFLTMAGLELLVPALKGFLNAVGVPVSLPHYATVLSGIQLAVALAALAWLGRVLVRRRSNTTLQTARSANAAEATRSTDIARAAPDVFVLVAALLVLSVVLRLISEIASLSARSTALLAGLFLALGAWGLLTSGGDLNEEQPRGAPYPRDGRVMLTAGYTLIANASVLYLGTLRVPGTSTPAADYLTSDPVTPLGLSVLGSSVIALAFIVHRRRGLPSAVGTAKPATEPAPLAHSPADALPRRPTRGSLSPSAASAGAVVAGLAAGLIVLAFIAHKRGRRAVNTTTTARRPSPASGPASDSPPQLRGRRQARRRLARRGTTALLAVLALFTGGCTSSGPVASSPIKTPYSASVPGPGCDSGGAAWSVPPGQGLTTHCLSTGLEVTAAHQGSGDVQFLPPTGAFPENYSISVHVDLSGMPDGCASIYTRASATGRYISYICTNSDAGANTYSWGVNRGESTTKQLAVGDVNRPSGAFTLESSTEGSDQQIVIDGAVASTSDATLTSTRYIALGISNSGSAPGSAVFSNFTITPLPANAHPCCSGLPALPVNTEDGVVVWYVDTGKAELSGLTTQLEDVGHASGPAAQGQACANLAAAVSTAQGDPPIPDADAESSLSAALSSLAQGAAACQSGNASGNTAELDQAASDIRTATADLAQVSQAVAKD